MSRGAAVVAAEPVDDLATAVDEARQGVLEARGLVVDWRARAESRRAELDQLRDSAGEAALDDPDAADETARRLSELEYQAQVADRAAAAQEPRVVAAERAYLEAELAVLDAEVAKHQAVLDVHDKKTAQLLKALEAHEGPFVPESLYLQARVSGGSKVILVDGVTPSGRAPASAPLRAAVEKATRSARIVRMLLAGEDPTTLLSELNFYGVTVTVEEFWPAFLWGPDALVPAPAWTDRVEAARARVDELEASIDETATYLATAEPTVPSQWNAERVESREYVGRQQAAEQLPGQLEQARAELAALTGEAA